MAGPRVLTPAYYQRLAEIEERHWWALGLRAIATAVVDRAIGARRLARVLDAGCGTGLTLTWLQRYAATPAVGLDLAREGLAFCARRGHRRLVQASTCDLPFRSDAFDLAVSLDVLQHLPRPDGDRRALAELARVLARGGWLLLRTNSRCGYPPTSAADYHRYTLGEVRRLVAGVGLSLRVSTYVNFVPGLLETLRRTITGQRSGTTDPGLGVQPRPPDASLLTRVAYNALLAERRYVASGRTLPFGHSILAVAEKVE